MIDLPLFYGMKVSSHAYSVRENNYSYKFKEDDSNSATSHEAWKQSNLTLDAGLLLI